MISVRRSIALSSAAALLLCRATVSAAASAAASAGPPPAAGRCHPPHTPGRAYARGDRASSSSPGNTAEHDLVACSPPGVGDCTASGSRGTRADDDVGEVRYNYLCDSDACDARPGGTNAHPPGLAATTWTLEGDGPCSVSFAYSRCV